MCMILPDDIDSMMKGKWLQDFTTFSWAPDVYLGIYNNTIIMYKYSGLAGV